MGTFYTTGATKADIVRELTAPGTCVKHSLRGNTLWAVRTSTGMGNPFRYIACFRLSKGTSGYGYKPMDESMHPYYYDCPLSFLPLARELSPPWRERVRAHHAAAKLKRAKP